MDGQVTALSTSQPLLGPHQERPSTDWPAGLYGGDSAGAAGHGPGCECISGMAPGLSKAHRPRAPAPRVVKPLAPVVSEPSPRPVEPGAHLHTTCWLRGATYPARAARRPTHLGAGECLLKEGRQPGEEDEEGARGGELGEDDRPAGKQTPDSGPRAPSPLPSPGAKSGPTPTWADLTPWLYSPCGQLVPGST